MLKHVRRATLALTTTAVVAAGLAGPAVAASPPPPADAAADWLATQLENGLVSSEYRDYKTHKWVTYTDYGLSLDFFFAFEGLGVKPMKRKRILNAIEPEVDSYVGSGSTTYAGAVGKLLTAVELQGRRPSRFSDQDLVSRLEGLVHTEQGDQHGRASDSFDSSDPYGGDFSNTIGQSFVVRALSGSGSELADDTTQFLLRQQCDAGFFRVYMESSDHTCDGGTEAESGPSVDATASAVEALLAVQRADVAGLDSATVRSALADAAAWLVHEQRANGAFREDGTANSNSTGLAAQALADLGRTRAAARAANWLAGLRVTLRMVRRTELTKRDMGAVAFSKAALKEARADGITREVRYQWRRATAQAVVGLADSSR